jgi:hypothetical protein
VTVAVPGNAALPAKPGCGFPESAGALGTTLDRAQQWLRGLTR